MTLVRLYHRLIARAARQPNGCLTLDGSRRYISVVFDGRKTNAHRAVWEFLHGPVPDGLEICHDCPGGDNTHCIEPTHLLCASHAWNMLDRDLKGRNGTLGENSPLAKLTREKVLEIDSLLASTNWGVIARRFGISEITVERIAKRQTWKHLFTKPITHQPVQRELIAA